jgi:hypothetical protein
MSPKQRRFIIWVLNNHTGTKQRVVCGRKDTFTGAERDRIVAEMIDAGHGVEVEPA